MGGELQAIDRKAADSLISWWLEAGVDAPVGESPRPWLHRTEVPASAPEQPLAPTEALTEVPQTLSEFQGWLAEAGTLPMNRPGAIRVAPHGVEGARLMILSDLPAREDAAEGRPIGGEAWELTLRMMAAIGVSPDEAYVASLGCFHVPGSRPSADELKACGEIARNHLRLAKPERLILFGDAPSKSLLGEPLARARGKIHRIEGVRTVATFQPRWLLQRPSDKALAWRDLLLLMSETD
jgi:uracil-DNA glycosylase family 4